MPAPQDANERLIVALDFPSAEKALGLVVQLEGLISFYKVGLELYTAAGPDFVRSLVAQGKKVFLDLKFFDIGETVRRATREAARLGATFLTVHEGGMAVQSAVQGAKGSGLKILAVTVLTSMDEADLQESGISWNMEDLVMRRARKSINAGCDGVIASGKEARDIRRMAGPGLIIVTPGIRPAGAAADDQKRAATPKDAIQEGADYLVVGRPIRDASNPRAAAQQILDEMQQGWAFRKATA
jgi:orotidine-5'-phosphate decarboxylase